ncbi:unnamed protein product [Symbiodinium natans]|uniref:Uncharacterized protein n=1 Tax=Symbiodinium natans TaxID=878477 RepID=A0A812MSJ3_9DINO|nr:unnamed protein product [Symbiodinium natans]
MPADCTTWSSQQSAAFVDAALQQIKEEITLGLHQASTHGIIHNVLMRSQAGHQSTADALNALLYQALQRAQEQQVIRGVTHDAVCATSQYEPHTSDVGATPAIYAEELSHTPAEVTHQGGTYGGKKTSVQLVREACWNFTCGNQCTSVIVRAAAIYHCTVGSPCPQWSTLSMLCTIQRGTYARTIVSNGARQITLCMGTIHQPCTALNTKALAQAPLKPLPSSMYFACHMSILLSDPGNTRGLALPQDWIVNDEEIIPAYDGVHADQDRRQLDTQRCPILLTGTGARYSLPRLVCPADQQEMPAQTGTEHVQALLEALIADDRPKILLCISYFLGQESVQSVQNRLETLTLKDLEPHAIARLAAGWKVMEKHQQLCLAFCLDDTEQATTPSGSIRTGAHGEAIVKLS